MGDLCRRQLRRYRGTEVSLYLLRTLLSKLVIRVVFSRIARFIWCRKARVFASARSLPTKPQMGLGHTSAGVGRVGRCRSGALLSGPLRLPFLTHILGLTCVGAGIDTGFLALWLRGCNLLGMPAKMAVSNDSLVLCCWGKKYSRVPMRNLW